MRVELYVGSPYRGYVTDEVSSIPTALANLSQETREKFVTDLAAVSRGKDESKNPPARYKALLKEAAPNEVGEGAVAMPCASRPLEFLPVIVEVVGVTIPTPGGFAGCDEMIFYMLDPNKLEENYDSETNKHVIKYSAMSATKFYNEIARFSFVKWLGGNSYRVYTNFRTLYNAGMEPDHIPFISHLCYKVDGETITINGEKLSVDKFVKETEDAYSTNIYVVVKVSELLKKGYTYDTIILDYKSGFCITAADEYEFFKAIKIKVPMFVWQQWPMTHTRLSKESQSDRVAEGEGYWLPEDLVKKIEDFDTETVEHDYFQIVAASYLNDLRNEVLEDIYAVEFINRMLTDWSQSDTQNMLQLLGYKREIWSRAPYYFKYKECVVTGWWNDPTTWNHSFLERSTEPEVWKNWTQKETKEVVEAVKKVIKGGK